MYKKILISLLLIFPAGNDLFSQDTAYWAPVGAKWHFTTEWCDLNLEGENCGYYVIESQKDTIVSGITAKYLTVTEYGEGSRFLDSSFIMYGDSDRVYKYDDYNNEFFTLYDFTLAPGDTFTIQDSIYRGYGIDTTNPILFRIGVDSVKTMNVQGLDLRVLYTSATNKSQWTFNHSTTSQGGAIFEKIGGVETMLGVFRGVILEYIYDGLRCYRDSSINFKNFEKDCDYITGIENQPKMKNVIGVYPNPVKDKLYIKMSRINKTNLVFKIQEVKGKFIS